jgi:hypothetical protein
MCCCSCWPACLFTAHMGGGSSPISCGVFLTLPLSQAFPLLVAGCRPCSRLSLSGQAQLVYLQFQEGFPSLHSRAHGAPPSLPSVFILIAYYSVSLFSLGGGQSVQGAMLIFPRDVCGSFTYHLAHLVCVFPSLLGIVIWRPGCPPGFSI